MDPRNNNPFTSNPSRESRSEYAANRFMAETIKTERTILQREYDKACAMIELDSRNRNFWITSARSTANVANNLKIQLDEHTI